MRDAFVKKLTELAREDSDIMFLTGDLGFGVFDDFEKEFPTQYLNVGVAEQNMTGIAAGLGLEGKKVFTYSIANFSTLRCLEQIRNDAAYHEVNLTVVSSGGGFTYGALGMSHHATEDLAIMRALPDVTVLAPSTAWEAYHATKAITETSGVGYLRIEKGGIQEPVDENTDFIIGKSIEVVAGEDLTIITCGRIIEECLEAAKLLKKRGITANVVSMHSIKPIDSNAILSYAKNTNNIITVEEHNKSGGLGSAVSEVLTDNFSSCKLLRIALEDKYSSIVGSQDYLRSIYKLDAIEIEKKSIELLKK
jgi:transketolase